MSASDLMGWTAAALTLLTFSMRSMLWLRLAALAANACFIVYGSVGGLYPMVALHVLLVPCNLYRLSELLDGRPILGLAARAVRPKRPTARPPKRRLGLP